MKDAVSEDMKLKLFYERNNTIENQDEKKKFLRKKGLKYIDRKVSSYIKDAKKGSTIDQIKQFEQKTQEKTKVQLAENYQMKLRLKLFRGTGALQIKNPYVESGIHFSVKGDFYLKLNQRIDDLNLNTSLDYHVFKNSFEARISEYYSSFEAGVSYFFSPSVSSEKSINIFFVHKF